MNAAALRDKRKAVEERHSEPARVRLHRATRWLARAEQETGDDDARFIFLWISFNAAYAQELGPDLGERGQLAAFFRLLLQADPEKRLQKILFGQFSGPIHTLVENRFCLPRSGLPCVSMIPATDGKNSSRPARKPRCTPS